MSAPTVAAIIPTHDRPELATLALRSALGQSYRELEIWLVDDGSNRRWDPPSDVEGDPRLHTIRLDRGYGPAAARNLAASRSRAPLLAFLDDDDEWFRDKIGRQVAALGDSPEGVAAVECGYEMWDETNLQFRFVPRLDRDLGRTLLQVPCMQPSTVLMRASAFRDLDGFDARRPRTEDWDLGLRFADRFGVTALPEVLVKRRTNRQLDRRAALQAHRSMSERLAPRISRLPAHEAARVRAHHRFVEGIYLAEMGERVEARKAFWGAWRAHPRLVSPLLHTARTVVGETGWRLSTGAFRAIEASFEKLVGRDPLVRRW